MAIFFRASRKSLQYGLNSLINSFSYTLAGGGGAAKLHSKLDSDSVASRGHIDISKWKKVDARTLGITGSMISASSWTVLNRLRHEGYEAYLVGGCVRDLILNRIPKDFDVITTANHKQIKKKFRHSIILGKRFPICRVKIKGSFVEVASFDTVAKIYEDEEIMYPKKPRGCGDRDFLRWKNSLRRDFTINSLFLDPFTHKIYDYANGMVDLKSLKLRTLIPAHLSFGEDCARILRGLRIAARLGLSLTKDTETAIQTLYSSVMSLDKFRLMLELNYMLAYGAAENSLRLLWKFKFLEYLFPFLATYLDQHGSQQYAHSSCMLMKLFFHLDRLVACDRPCDCTVWVGLLAFHLALVTHPQDFLAIYAFAYVLYRGEWKEGIKFSRGHAEEEVRFSPEISGTVNYESDEELGRAVTQLASLVLESIRVLTEQDVLSGFVSKLSSSPCSDLVFIPKATGKKVAEIFNVLMTESFSSKRESSEIDYLKLGKGHLTETRFVIAKVILETLNCKVVGKKVVQADNKCLQSDSSMESSDFSLSELVEDLEEKDRLIFSHSESKHERVKKLKLTDRKNISFQEKDRLIFSHSESKHERVKKLKLTDRKNISFQEKSVLKGHQQLGKQQFPVRTGEHDILTVLGQLKKVDIVPKKKDHGFKHEKIMVKNRNHALDGQCLDHATSHVKKAAKVTHKNVIRHEVERENQKATQQPNKVVLSSLFM